MYENYYPPALTILWKLLKANNINPAKVFSKYDLKFTDFNKNKSRIPLTTIYALWDDASELIDSLSFGLDAYQYWHPGNLGSLGYAWLSSQSLRDGFIRLSRFISIINPIGEIRLEEDHKDLTVIFDFKQPSNNLARIDQALSILLHMCRLNYQETLNPTKVNLARPKPDNEGDYFSYFKTNVCFDSPINSISFPLDIVNLPLPAADEQLAQYNDHVVQLYLSSLKGETLEDKVKNIIIKNLPSGTVSGEMVAEQFNMSYRSLQRKLSDKGSTFKALHEDGRKTLAKQYIDEGKMNVTEIAFLLGFGETSSFSRAYKRWTGYSPRLEKRL